MEWWSGPAAAQGSRMRGWAEPWQRAAPVEPCSEQHSDLGSFIALVSPEQTLPEQSLQWIKHPCGFCQHHVFLSTDIPLQNRSGSGVLSTTKTRSHSSSTLTEERSSQHAGDDAVQEERSPFTEQLPPSLQLPDCFLETGRGTELGQKACSTQISLRHLVNLI